MPAIIALVLIALVALAIASFAVHILFSPLLLLVIGILDLAQVPPATLSSLAQGPPPRGEVSWSLTP